ncbi:MAG: ATP-binding protein [Desulfobacteraceae bacterium]|nr:ATP-binding protein [Desulfobacteraceae bacterium]
MKGESWPADLASLPPIQAYVEILAAGAGLPRKRVVQVAIAVEEAVMNIINHAYADTPKGEIAIEFEDHPLRVVIRVIDTGIPFDPLGEPEPNIGLDLMERPIGGLGVAMIRNLMDGVTYERSENRNILGLVINKTE